MSKEPLFFADTTIVYYLRHSHSLVNAEVRRLVAGGVIALCGFVRGEYIRGFVIGLIELYFTIKEEHSVEDGITAFTADMGSRPRKLANALQSLAGWLYGFEDWQDLSNTLRRLGEYIRNCVYLLDHTFPTRIRDPIACEYGLLSFPQETYSEDQILDFYQEFQRIGEAPQCGQCEFRQTRVQELNTAGIDLHSPSQQSRYKDYKGYVKQAEWIEKALRTTKNSPTCWYCERLGDTIIALSAPQDAVILTGDKQSFPALAVILGKKILLVPSLDELRRQGGNK